MIKELEQLGFDVDVVHQRFYNGNEVSARGGRTIVIITDKNRKNIYSGVAICNPTDNYCRETGRNLALNRVLENHQELMEKVAKYVIKTQKPRLV